MDLYQSLLRPLIFSGLNADPETVQRQLMRGCAYLDQHYDGAIAQWMIGQCQRQFCLQDDRLRQVYWGLEFSNPVGLAAGFDKDGVASNIWPNLGFGFAEVGTVTFHAQPGNPRPRLFRLPADGAAINRMGFNNQGAEQLAATLTHSQAQIRGKRLGPLGINLGKSKIMPLDQAVEDYVKSFRLLKSLGDYFVVNVSSPNTPGLRSLQSVEQLDPILSGLVAENQEQKPIFLKIAPDLAWEDIEAIVDLVQSKALAGIIATNTTISREGLTTKLIPATGKMPVEEAGGLSGKPVRDRSTEVIRFIWKQTHGALPIIGVGGVFTAADAWEKITAGASLIQVYTGWLYEGPGMVKRVLNGLVTLLEQHNLSSIREAVALKQK